MIITGKGWALLAALAGVGVAVCTGQAWLAGFSVFVAFALVVLP